MTDEPIRLGIVQKIVRVLNSRCASGRAPGVTEYQGYGIVREPGGGELFFVDSSVVEGDFNSLEAGTKVTFVKEPGPLARAVEVRVCRGQSARMEPAEQPTSESPAGHPRTART